VRVLFTSIAAKAHLYLQVSTAWALRSAGHEVCVASQPDAVPYITGAGLTAVPVGEALAQEQTVRSLREREADADQEALGKHEFLRMDEMRPERLTPDFMLGVFSGMTSTIFPYYASPSVMDDLVSFARWWKPDLVIWDVFAFAGGVAARACGAAHARLLFGLDLLGVMRSRFLRSLRDVPPPLREDPMAEWLGWTMERYGGRFSEDLVLGQWTIDPLPSWMRLRADVNYVPVRHVPYNGSSVVPSWLRDPPRRPRVCLTLGVSFREVMGGDQVSVPELLEAVADLDVEVVATLNADQLASVPRVPDNVRVVDFVPLNELLPTCSAVVHQAGTGTMLNAMAHGVPQVTVPTDVWDNVIKARRLHQSGGGLCVSAVEGVTGGEVRALLERVLEEPTFAEVAATHRQELLGRPSPADLAPVLGCLTDLMRT
jgi:L-2-deoxyfucosyltransferase